jgi:hypothetical protein
MIGFAICFVLSIVLFVLMKIGKSVQASRGRAVLAQFHDGGLAAGRAALDRAYKKPTRERFILLGALGDLATLDAEIAAVGTKNWRGVWASLYGHLALATFGDDPTTHAFRIRSIAGQWAPKAGAFGVSVWAMADLASAIVSGNVASVSTAALAKAVPGQALAQAMLYHALSKACAKGGMSTEALGYKAQAEITLPCAA